MGKGDKEDASVQPRGRSKTVVPAAVLLCTHQMPKRKGGKEAQEMAFPEENDQAARTASF